MTSASFVNGLVAGLSAPAIALYPTRIETRIDPVVLKGSYRPASEDIKNIRGDFVRAIHNVAKETKANKQAK